MGSRNPGRYRREGREAFEPNVDPLDVNPYLNKKGFWWILRAAHWMEGWREAENHYIPEQDDGYQPYMVMAKYADDCGEEEAGTLDLRIIHTCQDMPIELEIDGVVYKPEF